MCSTRCDSPASDSVSATEPVAIQNPSVADRTVGIASVTTRTPESRTVRRGSANYLLSFAVARAAGAAPSAIAAAVAIAAAAARAAVTRGPRAAAATVAGGHEL